MYAETCPYLPFFSFAQSPRCPPFKSLRLPFRTIDNNITASIRPSVPTSVFSNRTTETKKKEKHALLPFPSSVIFRLPHPSLPFPSNFSTSHFFPSLQQQQQHAHIHTQHGQFPFPLIDVKKSSIPLPPPPQFRGTKSSRHHPSPLSLKLNIPHKPAAFITHPPTLRTHLLPLLLPSSPFRVSSPSYTHTQRTVFPYPNSRWPFQLTYLGIITLSTKKPTLAALPLCTALHSPSISSLFHLRASLSEHLSL